MSGNGNSGWNRPRANAESGARSAEKVPSKWKGIAAGLAIAVPLVALCLWMFTGGETRQDAASTNKHGRIKEVTPAAAPKKTVTTEVKKERVKPKSVDEAMTQLADVPKPEIPKRQLTPEQWDNLTNRVFHTGTEQLMSWVFTTEPGTMPIPIPNISKKDRENLVAILISKNAIKESDSEEVAAAKEQVDRAKKEMAKYIGDGGDPDAFLQYYYEELKTCFETRNLAIRQARELAAEDPELAGEFIDKVNEKFEKDGIKPLNKERFKCKD